MSSKAAASRDQTAKGCRTRQNWTIFCPPAAKRGEGHGACAPAPRLLVPIRPLAGRPYGSFAAPPLHQRGDAPYSGFRDQRQSFVADHCLVNGPVRIFGGAVAHFSLDSRLSDGYDFIRV